jgi:hypothetical protein
MDLTLLPRKMPEDKVKIILTKPLKPFSVVFQDMTTPKIFLVLEQSTIKHQLKLMEKHQLKPMEKLLLKARLLFPRNMLEVKVKITLMKPLNSFSVIFQDMTTPKIYLVLAQSMIKHLQKPMEKHQQKLMEKHLPKVRLLQLKLL